MALTQKDRELLAVIKYFNEEVKNKHVGRLVIKLNKEFGRDVAKQLTGFSDYEIDAFVMAVPKAKPSKQVQKLLDNSKAEIAALDAEAEPLFDTTTIAGRLANDLHDYIRANLNSGDAFLTQREVMQKFSVERASAVRAIRYLVQKDILERTAGVSPGARTTPIVK